MKLWPEKQKQKTREPVKPGSPAERMILIILLDIAGGVNSPNRIIGILYILKTLS